MNDEDLLDTQDAAQTALLRYSDAAAQHDRALRSLADCKVVLAALEGSLEALETGIIVDGGYGEHRIEGSNEGRRKAETRYACSQCPSYQVGEKALREAKHRIAMFEADAEEAANLMRMYRLQLEWATSSNYREAATGGRLPEFRRVGS